MSALHLPLKMAIEQSMLAVEAAARAGDANAAVFRLLDVFAAIGRDAAQQAWLEHYDAEERDERMREDEDALVFTCLMAPWSKIYPELPRQIESVLREAYQDEHFRCEDPAGWADINDEGTGQPEGRA